MKKVLSFVIFSLLTANSVFADVYCNDNGYCTGTIDGKSVNTYTNSNGYTTGTIGDESVNYYKNSNI